jgi:hypothetical protein
MTRLFQRGPSAADRARVELDRAKRLRALTDRVAELTTALVAARHDLEAELAAHD